MMLGSRISPDYTVLGGKLIGAEFLGPIRQNCQPAALPTDNPRVST